MRDRNSLNKVLLIGHIVRKPEIRAIPSGRSVARFQIATNEQIFNRETRQSTDRTEYHRIVAWGPLAEFCEKFLDTGRQILVEGRLRWRSWEDREGNRRNTTEVEAANIVMLGKRMAGSPETQPEEKGIPSEDFTDVSEQVAEDFPEQNPETDEDDEVPF
ncbi:MAG: single-stranded DNA-binding protein [Acidobacteriota bacterium]|nr:single-stranded DNA-binding protein [Acidobacteriota bacterium]MDY0231341.1 single-stranded DNA-binding protein [Candidatus Saccharicenans sp.]